MTTQDVSKCSVCGENADSQEPGKCVFHAVPEKKGCSVGKLSTTVRNRLRAGGHADFKSIIFPDGFQFPDMDVHGTADFTDAVFSTGIVRISSVRFLGKVLFRNNEINGILLFEDVVFDGGASLQFSAPVVPFDQRSTTTVIFSRVTFPPNATFFRELRLLPDDSRMLGSPVFVFRGCCLKDVYFDNCDMGLVSFFNSSFFEEAHIVACSWPSVKDRLWGWLAITEHTRQNLISEEWLLKVLRSSDHSEDYKESLCEQYVIPRSFSYNEAGGIYRRIKTSLDSIKAYEEAAWLYFNEIEMRKAAWMEEYRDQPWRHIFRQFPSRLFAKFPPFAWNLVYAFYKFTAGYGERPINSAVSFVFLLCIFACTHMLNGIRMDGREINYDISFHWSALASIFHDQFWWDFFDGAKYTLLRIVPTGYLPGKFGLTSDVMSNGLWDLSLSIANTVILSVLIVFIVVGLKRHFKRF